MEKFTVKNGKKLKCGYTTGSCAAAAAAAATYMLLSGERVVEAEILLPSGERIALPVCDMDIHKDRVVCAVIKDGGDDPDATHGAKIFAEVGYQRTKAVPGGMKDASLPIRHEDLILRGGRGVGTVTAKGLPCAVGEPAINPVPRRMIFQNVNRVRKAQENDLPLYIEISVPEGETIAPKTYNPRLGIAGGISILGTTGIVDPMSEKALVDTVKAVIDKQYEENSQRILIAPGNYGRDFCREVLGLDIERAVPVSNYIGEALDYIRYKGFQEILLVGHTGKLVKLGAGIMNTHSSYADGRMETIGVHSAICGAPDRIIKKIMECTTTDEAFDLIGQKPYCDEVKERIVEKVQYHLNFRLRDAVRIETMMFTANRSHILKSAGADEMIEKIRKDQKR